MIGAINSLLQRQRLLWEEYIGLLEHKTEDINKNKEKKNDGVRAGMAIESDPEYYVQMEQFLNTVSKNDFRIKEAVYYIRNNLEINSGTLEFAIIFNLLTKYYEECLVRKFYEDEYNNKK